MAKTKKVVEAKPNAGAPAAVKDAAKPFIRYVDVPFSRWQFAKSFQVIFSLALLVGSLYLLCFSPSVMHVTTSRGMVMQNMKKDRSRLASRMAEQEIPKPGMVYADLVLLGLVGVATASFVHGCVRRVRNAQQNLALEQLEALREAMYNPEALAQQQKIVSDDRKEWEEENARRAAKGRPKLRERRTVHAIATADALTSFFVIVTITLTALVAMAVQLQAPNEARGLSAVVLIIMLVGGIICPSFDPSLKLVMSYSVVCELLSLAWVFVMCFFATRAQWA